MRGIWDDLPKQPWNLKYTVGSVNQERSTQPSQDRLPGESGWTGKLGTSTTAGTRGGRQAWAPTFGSFQVPDADRARLGAGHDELLGGVETDALHGGRVTRQALRREGSSFGALCQQTPRCCPQSWIPRKLIKQGSCGPPGLSAPRAESGPDPSHTPSPAVLPTGTSPAGAALRGAADPSVPSPEHCPPGLCSHPYSAWPSPPEGKPRQTEV